MGSVKYIPNTAANSGPESITAPRWLAWPLSFPVLLGAMLVTGTWAGVRLRLPDPDTWWHLAVGQTILAHHTLPVQDVYSFTAAGSPWIAYEWLGEVVMAMAARAGSLQGLELLLLALSGSLVLLLWTLAYLHCRNVKAAFIACVLLLPLAGVVFSLRPQLLGYGFLLLTLIVLERYRQGSRQVLWALPPLFVLWVNTHGSFVLGLFVIALYWAAGLWEFDAGPVQARRWTKRQRIDLEWVFLLSLVALTLTPYGTKLAAYPLEMALLQPLNVANITEWQPLSFQLALGKFMLGLLLAFLVTQWLVQMKWRLQDLALFLCALVATCLHIRFTFFLVVATAPVLAMLAVRWVGAYEPQKDRYVLNAVLLAALATVIVKTFPAPSKLRQLVAEDYPAGAVRYLQHQAPVTHLMNEFGWGGYLIWKLGRQQKVFIDGRTDFYEYAGVLADYLNLQRLAPDTPFILRKYQIRACLIRTDAPLAMWLAVSPGWRKAYQDGVAVLYVNGEQNPAIGSEVRDRSRIPKTMGFN
ncbi:MAG TPA: hypothetical protein VMX16_03220 [Terriglobia bacterium]|nr:hypothetical protein [Terriglobia bacterium]